MVNHRDSASGRLVAGLGGSGCLIACGVQIAGGCC
jgi:hypothetical protein